MAELVDCFAGLTHGLLADRARVAPLQREVLPQQHAQFVGSVVQLRTRDVAVHSQQIEPGLASQLHVATHLGGRRVAQGHARRRKVCALHEHRLAVDGEDPVLQHDFAQAGAHCAGVADHLVDRDLDLDVGQLLFTERPRPPQPGLVDVEVPVDFVESSGERLFVLVEQLAVDARADPHGSGHVAVEAGVQTAGVPACR